MFRKHSGTSVLIVEHKTQPTPAHVEQRTHCTPAHLEHRTQPTPANLEHRLRPTPAHLEHRTHSTPAHLEHMLRRTPAHLEHRTQPTPAHLEHRLHPTPAHLEHRLHSTTAHTARNQHRPIKNKGRAQHVCENKQQSSKNMKWQYVIIAAIFCASYVDSTEIPEFLHVCKKADPDPESCFTNSIQDLQTVFKTGDPKYDIPSLEPLELGDLLVSQNTANQGVKVSAKDIKSYGSSNYKISKMKVDFANNIYHFEVFLPRMRIEGRYVVDGRILLLPIHGSGRVHGNVTDCRGDTTMYGEKYMKDGVQLMRFNKLDLKIKVGNGQFHLSNLFGGDKLLGDVINEAINQNFDLFVKDLIPLLEDALGKKFLSIGNSFMSRFTYDQLFPEK